ncbi:MAG: HAD-IIB family hydrolase [Aeropyrum sp.]|nr:HAD-IIB family hydrolase [Aeropyrum sp.]
MRARWVRPCSGVIFTDLDNTLVDRRARPGGAAIHVVEALSLGYLVVPVTSKSIYEIVELWDEIGVPSSLRLAIPESGGALYAPKGTISKPSGYNAEVGLEYLSLGPRLEDLEREISILESMCEAERLSKASPRLAAEITGLPLQLASLAARREYLEVFWSPNRSCLEKIHVRALKLGLYTILGSRTAQVAGHKGKGAAALEFLKEPVLAPCSRRVIAVGDSSHDQPLIEIAEYSFRIANEGAPWDKTTVTKYRPLPLEAPEGWSAMWSEVKSLLNHTPSY